jgi:hypothetical protein
MNWSYEKRARILLEERILQQQFPRFSFRHMSDPERAYIEGPYSGPDLFFSYRLALYLYPDHPYEMPSLYVHFPIPLYTYDGRLVPESSHEFHTTSRNDAGEVEICHCHENNWTPDRLCVGALTKGIMWLEAYENHLKTGESIAAFFDRELERRIGPCRT